MEMVSLVPMQTTPTGEDLVTSCRKHNLRCNTGNWLLQLDDTALVLHVSNARLPLEVEFSVTHLYTYVHEGVD